MNDREPDEILRRWAATSATAARIAMTRGGKQVPATSSRAVPITTFAVVVLVVVAVAMFGRSGSAPGPGTTANGLVSTPSAASPVPSTPSATVTTSASASESPLASESPEPSPSGSPNQADLEQAAKTAAAFETARAAGDWSIAWNLLSAYSKGQYATQSNFEVTEKAYNAKGGSKFSMAAPTQDADLLDPAFLGAPGSDAQARSDFSRAALVFANHPLVKGASEASRAYLIAPLPSGTWLVWVVR